MKNPFIRSLIVVFALLVLSFTAVYAAYTGPGARTLQTGTDYFKHWCTVTYSAPGWGATWYDRMGRWAVVCPSAHVEWNSCCDDGNGGCNECFMICWDDHAVCEGQERNIRWPSPTVNVIGDTPSTCTPGSAYCGAVPVYTTYDPATVDASLDCDYGLNGWCKAGATLSLWGIETIPSKTITRFETAAGTLCSGASCDYPVVTEGTNTLTYWAVSSFGDTSTQKTTTIKIDGGYPTASLASTGGGTQNASGWYTTNTPFVLTTSGTDAVSGVGTKTVFVNSASHTSPYTLSTEGDFTIYGEVTDLAGNAMQTDPITIQRDFTKPTFTLNQSSAVAGTGWFTSPLTLSITGNDAVSGYSHSDYSTGSDSGEMPVTLDDGVYTVDMVHYDVAGNSDTSSGAFKVDSTPPTANLAVTGGTLFNGWYNTSTATTLTTTGDDLTSGINTLTVFVDGSSKTTPFDLTSDGVFTVYGKTSDLAGNTEETTPITISRDNTDPTFTLDQSDTLPGTGWFIAPLTVSVTGNDALSGYGRTDYTATEIKGAITTGTMPVTLNDGSYTLDLTHYDVAGNAVASTSTYNIDTTKPAVTMFIEGATAIVTIHGKAIDETSGIDTASISLDTGLTWTPVTVSSSGDWEYLVDATKYTAGTVIPITLKVTDQAGNINTQESSTAVDSVAPVAAITTEGTSDTINIFGEATDAGSGIAQAELSFDDGETWSVLTLSDTGAWSRTLDSTLLPDGTTTLLAVRAYDRVGNVTLTKATLTTSNAPVTINLQSSWTLPYAGTLEIKAGYSPIESVVVKICDTTGSLGCIDSTYTTENIPTSVSWNGSFGSEQAHSGDYSVLVTVTDKVGRVRSAAGTITVVVEEEAVVFTEQPSEEAFVYEETPEPEPAAVNALAPVKPQTPKSTFFGDVNFVMAPSVILLGLLGVFGATTLFDPRTSQWNTVDASLQELADNLRKNGGEEN